VSERKVTALITRPGVDGPELLVFEHPVTGLQVPAGTVEEGESFATAALREGWEETGALGLELVRELTVIERPDEERHVFHLRATVEMVDRWQVMTPDGGGLVWWCSWRPIDDARAALHAQPGNPQLEWLDAARPALDESAANDPPVRARPPLPLEFARLDWWEEFWAYPFFDCRFVAAYDDDIDPDQCVRSRGVCVTEDGDVLLVLDNSNLWGIPGGGREVGESSGAAFVREVWEEARARVVASRFLTAMRIARLDEHGGVEAVEHHAHYWARVEVEPWVSDFETIERSLLPATETLARTAFPGHLRSLLTRAARIDPCLRAALEASTREPRPDEH
jgi:8-oxo-dGTP pyrophosphatase MutT (NUDIX family)